MTGPDQELIVYPPVFAQRVVEAWNSLEEQPTIQPSLNCLTTVLDILYQASFLHEEGQPVRCRLIISDSTDWKQGEGPPNGFHVLRFAEPRPFTPQEIRKLAPAASYYRSILGVKDDGAKGLSIWGIIQTGTRWVNRVDGGRLDGAPLPPQFVGHILGAGRLMVARGYLRLLELNSGHVLNTGFDPFKSQWLPGHFRPVRQWLQDRLTATRLEGANVEDCFVRMMAQSVVRRILSIVRSRGHGGMLIYLPQESANLQALSHLLRIRCAFEPRASTEHFSELMLRAMTRLSLVGHKHGFASVSWSDYQKIDDPILSEIDESFFEIANLFADLMSVDGALILTKRFEVVGFGAEVLGERPISEVFRAVDLEGSETVRERADSSGTRHRSAYRFVSEVPESLAIVISQDGAIRFVTGREGRVVYWPYLP
jgi:DNA integrity scanning protein DisA with diadenylate cyclase activity